MSSERVLVVGGTGFVGSHIARHLDSLGYVVTVSARARASSPLLPGIDRLRFVASDYTSTDGFSADAFEGINAVVFAAGNDIRHVGRDDEDDHYWAAVQSDGVPRFAALARDAGVRRFVQIGSYYHQVLPELAETSAYVRARQAADVRSRELTCDTFAAITLNPPSIVGSVPGGVQRRFARMVQWARGERLEPGLYAPSGGTNYMSVRSVAQAVAGAIEHGEPGRAYLIGDENLSYQQFFQLFADAAGGGVNIDERDEEHPFQPDRFIVQGRGQVLRFEPEAAEVALLGYERNDVRRAVAEIVAAARV